MGYGTVLFVPINAAKVLAFSLQRPEDEDFYLIGFLRMHTPENTLEEITILNQKIYNLAVRNKGYLYPCDSTHIDNWQEHYNENCWDTLNDLKLSIDPNGLFSTGLNIFAQKQSLCCRIM